MTAPASSFSQSGAIRNYVFPILASNVHDSVQFLGSGFLIGSGGFALTAAHVVRTTDVSLLRGLFVDEGNRWHPVAIEAVAMHEREDVALVKFERSMNSFFRLSGTWEGSSLSYECWGYPSDAALEVVNSGVVVLRPDLVYSRGYVRRRLTNPGLPAIAATELFELSDLAGSGCSGSPVVKRSRRDHAWDVVGVYVGERHSEGSPSVGYAVREDAFRDWRPAALNGRSVFEESCDIVAP